ncbi:MAG: hypothetical protein HKN82_13185 [Akkermansiaceae bacterium]|nr:hypothetical protein [Akkermansiaceae bacterium]NNM31076.1 hypothetical protein [Akkermansiaceae bacterium]
MMKPTLLITLFGIVSFAANAATIASYDAGVSPTAGTTGAADPTTQGWASSGATGNDFAYGADSTIGGWRITDGTGGAGFFYDHAITVAEVANMQTFGWTATWTNTINHDAVSAAGGGVDDYYNTARQTNNQFWLSYGATSYLLTHSVDANGDFTLSDGTNLFQITTANNQMSEELGAGAPLVNQYVTYTLDYDATAGQATLTDSLGNNHGVVASGGALPGGDRLVWGATSGAGQGSTTWNAVGLDAVPEPGVSILGALAGLVLLRRRR